MRSVMLAAALVAFSMTSLHAAGDTKVSATIEEVNANPEKFAGKTVTFQKVSLYGNVTTGSARFRFAVKSPKGTVMKASFDQANDQQILFVTRNKDEKARKFVETLSPEYYYTVNLTVSVEATTAKKGPNVGKYYAIIESVDNISSYRAK
jgi:hypothetical protein